MLLEVEWLHKWFENYRYIATTVAIFEYHSFITLSSNVSSFGHELSDFIRYLEFQIFAWDVYCKSHNDIEWYSAWTP